MDRMIYIAMTGAQQVMRAQAVNANNLANVNTTGFRAQFTAQQQLPVYGPVVPSRAYVEARGTGIDLAPGTLVTTGRALDIAVDGEGFLAVQAPDGTEAYTRAGNLRVTETGQLVTANGHPVLGDGGPIAIPPFQKLEIGADGSISIIPLGQNATTMAVVERIRLVSPDPGILQKNEFGLLSPMDGSTAPADASIRVVTGVLETSNVDAVGAMTRMIDLARQYEMQVKMMKTAKENDAAAAQLLKAQ